MTNKTREQAEEYWHLHPSLMECKPNVVRAHLAGQRHMAKRIIEWMEREFAEEGYFDELSFESLKREFGE